MGESPLRRSCAEAFEAAMQSPAPARGPAGATTGREASGGGDGAAEGASSHTIRRPGEYAHGAMGGITVLMEFCTRQDVEEAEKPLEHSAKQKAAERTRALRGIFDAGPHPGTGALATMTPEK